MARGLWRIAGIKILGWARTLVLVQPSLFLWVILNAELRPHNAIATRANLNRESLQFLAQRVMTYACFTLKLADPDSCNLFLDFLRWPFRWTG
jgi:hypothetical protein